MIINLSTIQNFASALIAWTGFSGLVIPYFVALVTKAHWSSKVKQPVMLASAATLAILTYLAVQGWHVHSWTDLFSAIGACILGAQAAYHKLWGKGDLLAAFSRLTDGKPKIRKKDIVKPAVLPDDTSTVTYDGQLVPASGGRSARKYGRLAPIPSRPRLTLSTFLKSTAIPSHPASVDYGAKVASQLKMLGNDQYGDCVTPDTLILRGDLQWIPAGDLSLRDKLVAFTEDPLPSAVEGGKSKGRYYQTSYVECIDRVMRPCYELEFDDGTVVKSSAGHRWLIGSISNGARWAKTEDLKAGSTNASNVCKPLDVWATGNSWEAGYLSAAWDGEGNLDQHGVSKRLMFSQVDNAMAAQFEHCMKSLDIEYTHSVDTRSLRMERRQDVHRFAVGRREQFLRALGIAQPARLMSKVRFDDLGRMDRTHVARLVRKTFLGEQEVVMLNTTSRTYFAEGLASHNCVAVTWANDRLLTTAWLTPDKISYPTQDQVYAFYKTQNPNFPNQDKGMVIQLALEYLVKTGGPDGVKAVAFAAVDVNNLDELQAAVALFGGIWLGINVTDANQTEFDKGQPWDYVRRSPIEGGHAVPSPGYDAETLKFFTWADETSMTEAFMTHQLEEAWVVVWPEHLGSTEFQEGVDLAALASAYTALTGDPFPVDVPTPTPEPGPTPVPTPQPDPTPVPAAVEVPADLAADVTSWAKRTIARKDDSHTDKAVAQEWLTEVSSL